MNFAGAKRHIPKPLYRTIVSSLTTVSVALEFIVDYFNYSRTAGPRDGAVSARLRGRSLEAQLTKDYHRVEKGLSLQSPKKPFGADVAKRLDLLIDKAERSSIDSAWLGHASDARAALRKWNETGEVDERIAPRMVVAEPGDGSIREVEQFFLSRHSVRDFDGSLAVDRAELERAVRMAMCTPSVCNRQAARVRFFSDGEEVDRVLSHQNGNTGFRHQVPVVAIVSVERGLFSAAGERNQMWIDGGLFAMSLVWALHGIGLASCMLNWSMTNGASRRLKQVADIPVSEDIVMLIAIGHANTTARVARSPRRSIDEIATFR